MSDWKTYRIEELAAPGKNSLSTGPFGTAISSRFFRPNGVPVIRGGNLSLDIGRRLVEDELAFVDEDKAKEFQRSQVVRGDLVFTCWGTIGQIGLIDKRARYDRYIVSNKQMKLKPNPSLVDSLFLYYALSTPDSVATVHGISIGSSVPGFNLSQLRKVSVRLPPLNYQKSVAGLLGALDDKMVINERIAVTARALAQARFSQAIREGDAREVRLADAVQLLTRGVTPRYTDEIDQLIVLNQKCIRNGRVTLGVARRTRDEKVPAQKLLQADDVLVNSTGVGTLGRVARWTSDCRATVDSHVMIVRFDAARTDPIFGGFAMLAAQPEIERLGEGSTGQTELSRKKLGDLRLVVPGPEPTARLRSLLEHLEEAGDRALTQNQVLAEMRDTLLPKLISGELRIRDAERAVEDAV